MLQRARLGAPLTHQVQERPELLRGAETPSMRAGSESRSGDLERGSPLGDVCLGSAPQEDVHDPGAAVGAGVVQRGVLLPARGPGVGSCPQQLFDHAQVAAGLGGPLRRGARGVQRGLALLVRGQHVRSVAEEELHVRLQASPRRHMQRREPRLPLPHADIRTCGDQQLRTPGTKHTRASWRAVFPPGSSFTSAPRNSSSSTHPACPLPAARRSAEVCFALELSVHMPADKRRGSQERVMALTIAGSFSTAYTPFMSPHMKVLWTAVSLQRTCDGGARTCCSRCCLGGLGARGSGSLVMALL
ncbi:hypothetical protein EYF80_029019 [Liparis tanakae]|uniref:GATA-type transcription activator N-terminal domain-containing protein n=1 Tax=Liparis tanakae TaxID=230148 RepID=A0A4Z2H6A3_9TELE|nr:hypothetical protein EYF80_029019 [Liparis tanakae]